MRYAMDYTRPGIGETQTTSPCVSLSLSLCMCVRVRVVFLVVCASTLFGFVSGFDLFCYFLCVFFWFVFDL
eukprot:m.109709 g.109709  ORF g.109709 m.109709 type:complete len:71 (-) comp27977_c1_seq2:337-549(-)